MEEWEGVDFFGAHGYHGELRMSTVFIYYNFFFSAPSLLQTTHFGHLAIGYSQMGTSAEDTRRLQRNIKVNNNKKTKGIRFRFFFAAWFLLFVCRTCSPFHKQNKQQKKM
jgi:hypothetical protein